MHEVGYDVVTLIPLKRRKRLEKLVIRLRPGGVTNTKWGILRHDDLAKAIEGTVVKTHLGEEFIIFRATLEERVELSDEFKHVTQIIRPRDWGLIWVFADITSESKIVEIGTGAGGMLAFLCRSLGTGHVFTYELREDRAKTAEENLKRLGVPKRYTLKIRDAREGVDERDADVVLIDIPTPWEVLRVAWETLRPGGRVVIYVPTANQVARVLEEMYRMPWVDIRILEGFVREIQPLPYAVRPELRGFVFSAYIIIARKSLVRPPWYDEILKMCEELRAGKLQQL